MEIIGNPLAEYRGLLPQFGKGVPNNKRCRIFRRNTVSIDVSVIMSQLWLSLYNSTFKYMYRHTPTSFYFMHSLQTVYTCVHSTVGQTYMYMYRIVLSRRIISPWAISLTSALNRGGLIIRTRNIHCTIYKRPIPIYKNFELKRGAG